MASFSIDDVRDTLTADITRFLMRVEETAVLLVGSSPANEADESGFRLVEDAGHAMFGTSALVGAESLASSAKLLEELAERGRSELRLAAAHAGRARKIAEVIRDGAGEMRTMLELEVSHRGDDAQWVALDWQERAGVLLGAARQIEDAVRASLSPPAAMGEDEVEIDDAELELLGQRIDELAVVEQGGEDDEPEGSFAFDADGTHDVGDPPHDEPVPSAVEDEIQSELAEVFRDEARACMVALREHLTTLFATPTDLVAARGLERLYHTLKGAAATVGLVRVSDDAFALQERLEAVVEQGEPVTVSMLDGLVGDTIRLLGAAGLSDAELGALAPAPTSATIDRAITTVFFDESRDICAQASELLDGAESGSGADSRIEELAELFHRLKGSALLAGESAISSEAERLEAACRPSGTTPASVDHARQGIARLRTLLGRAETSEGETSGAVDRVELAPPDPELWRAFSEECAELLEGMDRIALGLEESDSPRERLKELLPPLHTLKGVVNTMGLAPTGRVLHRVEDFLEELTNAAVMPAMRAVASFLLEIQVDVRRAMKQAAKGFVETSPRKLDLRMARVRDEAFGRGPAEPRSAQATDDSEASEASASRGGASRSTDRRFVRVGTDRLDALMNLAGELVVSRSRLLARVDALRTLQSELGRGSRRLLETVDKFCDEHEFARLDGAAIPLALAAGAESMSVRSIVAQRPANDGTWSAFGELELDRYEDIHILSRSLTEMTSDFGEMYGQLAQRLVGLTEDADAFGGIVSGIQSEVTRARMVPLEVLFSRLRLPIRDASHREGKEVRVTTRGEDVHLDKTIADALFQPMLHLVRNAVAHGLESAGVRESSGKPRIGTVELSARQELGQIVLEVRDDGAGLDLAKLRARGVAMGLLSPDVDDEDPSIPELVFAAGLSTHAVAGDVAGRGIGCELVRRAIERLNGSIRVESHGGSSTTFVLTMPLTLAITKALLVEQGGQAFAIPLYFAERILDADEHEIVESAGLRRVRLDGRWVSVQRLGGFLGRGDAVRGPIVVLRVGTERVLVQVDAVVGQEEIVVKNLGAVLAGHPLFAGVTIRGNGQMVLILDVPGLLQSRGARPVPPRPRPVLAPAMIDTQRESDPVVSESGETPVLRVMFVDDSLSVRKVAEKAFASLGVHVTTAVNGLDALEKIRDGAFDIVFTDLEMPRMHGFELIRELRFLKAHQELPIVVVTSRSGQKHQDQARALGANEYLTKPFTPQSLGAAIEKWARRRTGKGGAS